MRYLINAVIAFGVSLTVAGLCSFVFGLVLKGPIYVQACQYGLNWVNGNWLPGHYCFLGTLLASTGSGLIALGGLSRK